MDDALISKIVLHVLNIIFMVTGLGVMIFGIIALANPEIIVDSLSYIPNYGYVNQLVDIQELISNNGILLTCFGAIIFLICFIGIVGTCSKGTFVIATYALLVVLLLLTQLGFFIYMAVDYQGIQDRVATLMLSSLKTNFEPVVIDSGGVITNNTNAAWSTFQFENACCGANNYTDYQSGNIANWPPNPNPGYGVPPSCCMLITQYHFPTSDSEFVDLNTCRSSSVAGSTNVQYVNTQGCVTAFIQVFRVQSDNVTMIILASLVALEVIVLLLATHVISARHKENRVHYA